MIQVIGRTGSRTVAALAMGRRIDAVSFLLEGVRREDDTMAMYPLSNPAQSTGIPRTCIAARDSSICVRSSCPPRNEVNQTHSSSGTHLRAIPVHTGSGPISRKMR